MVAKMSRFRKALAMPFWLLLLALLWLVLVPLGVVASLVEGGQ